MRLYETLPLDIVDLPADRRHYTPGRGGHLPRLVIMHHTAGRDSRLWLSTTSSPPVSCHRLISKAGVIFKIVEDEHTAYCAGFGTVGPVDPDSNDPPGAASNLNLITLHIELENLGNGRDPYPLEQLESAGRQFVEWEGKYGCLSLMGHYEVDANKNDPRWNEADWHRFYKCIDLARITQRVEV